MEKFIPILIFIVVTGMIVLLYSFWEEWQKEIWIGKRFQVSPKAGKQQSGLFFLGRILQSMGMVISPEEERKKIREKLIHAGYRDISAPVFFYGIKTVLGLTFAIIFMMYWLAVGGMSLIFVIFPLAAGYYLPGIFLNARLKSRKKKIFRELPDTLDLLIICLEAGLGFDMALLRVSEEMESIAPVLGREFARYFYETRSGIPRDQALSNLKERNGEQSLENMINVIIQSGKYGTGIAGALRVHSDTLRTERKMIAEEKGGKISAKLTIPMILLIVPALFIIILGPGIICMLKKVSGIF